MRTKEREREKEIQAENKKNWVAALQIINLYLKVIYFGGKFISFKTLIDVKSSEFYRIKATK